MYVPFSQWGLIVLDRQSFELSVVKPDIDSLTQAVFDAKKGDVAARDTIVASLCWSAFCCPAALMNTYDLISNAWLRNVRIAAEKNIRMPSSAATAPLDKSFWQAFWTVVDEQNFDAAIGAYFSEILAPAENKAICHPEKSNWSIETTGNFLLPKLISLPDDFFEATTAISLIGNCLS